ncbi:M20 family metallopeptidase [Leeia sp. TBRC 13508]|uniref:M20 family metallopeptidase n=1 Tax=Leeia speluncae TaxID=2884804 RepID=A0ABS8DAN9_9NEIS|nr:M20 aminoacylase family protein [Leeia speluncae]MCB6185068.1 M20 family metallopeptidase [Leeia speluncae]
MTLIPSTLQAEMQTWRQQLHAHPEFGFEETLTAAFVAEKLRSFGIQDVVESVGGTGVVATLRCGSGSRSIGLRADMDALRIHENGCHVHKSTRDGYMHACGHDGHTTMLLGAAKTLAEDGGFDGTVRLIFQPAEEWGKGAQAMIADGLLTRFPIDEIYGVHNWPGIPVGHFETCVGPAMSAEDNFEIIFSGMGGHASRPHEGREVMVAACAAVLNLQTIVSRRCSPTDIAVVSVTEIFSDGIRNALPGQARILGDARSFRTEVSTLIEQEMRRIAAGTAAAYGCEVTVNYTREFIPLINDPVMTRAAVSAAEKVFLPGGVAMERPPITASEDFAQFLTLVPGCFGFIGNGDKSFPLHNPNYDFNDQILGLGAQYFVTLTRDRLTTK